ncbi:glycosyltransferase family 2 protein [Nocardia sp. CDC160]|uniref:glycosyltransferase family 2 protein n=1 Tax=Nocardia sp. CDC160 TaxID=3112166 RepID=UPI002DB6100A|nr:glycosyltransferase family 2 protein [Nocardia sp. CDC160]MEC3920362.1 glycosyltransferase family 2 protein [Nocardia sp. CDC160]
MVQELSTPRLSVVVPVLNEADFIERALERLVSQEAVTEVIVVDNGSTDGTPEVVRSFAATHGKVELIFEPRRGIAPARNAGFDKARGELVGRTDADTLVDEDWAATIVDFFTAHPDTGALTGLCTYYDSPIGFLLVFGQRLLIRCGRLGGRVGNMYGPNMAIRRSTWLEVRDETRVCADVAEDLDLALCITKHDIRIDQLTNLRAQTSARRRRSSPRSFWRFQMIGLRTIRDHGFQVRPAHWTVVLFAWLSHTLQWPVYRFWDFNTQRLSFRPGAARISAVG